MQFQSRLSSTQPSATKRKKLKTRNSRYACTFIGCHPNLNDRCRRRRFLHSGSTGIRSLKSAAMLHELLLALSGHPSPLFDKSLAPNGSPAEHSADLPFLSPPESSLLASIGTLSELHRKLHRHLETISAQHASTVCRAVANSIRQVHLARFQRRILEIESKILTKDTGLVGAYEIVPLASVVEKFDDWHRPMAWYWDLSCFMMPPGRHSADTNCSGAAIIDRLRSEMRTGFNDIEDVAVELSRIAETAWLKQLSAWVLHGNLPSSGKQDFLFRINDSSEGEDGTFGINLALKPGFVSNATASSMLFIGKCLNQVHRYRQRSTSVLTTPITDAKLASTHLSYLSSLCLPIQAGQLNRTISAIRSSLSQNVLQHLLPMDLILRALSCLRQYFLLHDGEFALVVINEAESKVEARWQSKGRLLKKDPLQALRGLTINDAELNHTLSQVWNSLSNANDADEDEVMEFARKHVSLSASRRSPGGRLPSDTTYVAAPQASPVSYDDLLLLGSTSLRMDIPPPLDLILSPHEVDAYSAISSYLLSVRRAQLRLGNLWRQSSARRHHPAPAEPRFSSTESGRSRIAEARVRTNQRAIAMRKVWATCSATLFLLSETAAYFEGEVIKPSWEHFDKWVIEPQTSHGGTDDSGSLSDLESSAAGPQRDPETIRSGHRAFVAALTYALLLTDLPYTRELRSLLGNIDQLIAFFVRLLDVQQKADLEHDADGLGAATEDDERKTALELDRARKKVDSDLKSVIGRLRQLDRERIGAARYLDPAILERGGFVPWKAAGVDRLLMKLEFGHVPQEKSSIA